MKTLDIATICLVFIGQKFIANNQLQRHFLLTFLTFYCRCWWMRVEGLWL